MNYTRILRRMRQRIFSYPSDKEAKAERVIGAVKCKVMAQPQPPPVRGPFSGLTRRELNASGTCETDWF